jgi:radical SAM superfamily enzyme YgiQ (UPF0313 family)
VLNIFDMSLDTQNSCEKFPLMRVLEGGGEILSYLRGRTSDRVREIFEQGWNMLPPNIQDMAKTAGNMVTMAGTAKDVVISFTREQAQHAIEQAFQQFRAPETTFPDHRIEAVTGKKIVVWLVHPTNYRKDGTPRKWKKQILPSNAIGQLHALLPAEIQDGSDRKVPVECHFLEDTVQAFDVDAIADSMRGEDVTGAVLFCGVQTNQWPRALDLASLCREKGIPVIMGGYHVRADLPFTSKQARELGISLAIGEAEAADSAGRPLMEGILSDLAEDDLQPEYRQKKNPDISFGPLSNVVPEYQDLMYNPAMATLETSRGCPLPCSFCTIRTIGGREVRARNPGKMKSWLRKAYLEKGIRSIFITDDNFARNNQRFDVLKMLEELRGEGKPIEVLIQVDTKAAKGEEGKRFVEACGRAGVYSVFLGVESLDPETLKDMRKSQNDPSQYREVAQAWHGINAIVQCGFIIGNQKDTAGVGKRSAHALVDMGVDLASAFVLTPLPGSVDYHDFHQRGIIKGRDFNAYDSHSEACIQFPGGLTSEQILQESEEFYREFYSFKNFRLLAEKLNGESLKIVTRQWIWYKYSSSRGDHPMYSGIGSIRPDYIRQQFQSRLPDEVSDLAPSPDGPGSPASEKIKKPGKTHLPVIAGTDALI